MQRQRQKVFFVQFKTKKPAYRLAFEYFGGEGGIRTRDKLSTYTHFPGVLLQPLGHLSRYFVECKDTKLFSFYETGRILVRITKEDKIVSAPIEIIAVSIDQKSARIPVRTAPMA